MSQFKHLFTPINIGGMTVKNRIVMSPMTTDYGTMEQEISSRLIAYHEARAKGGVGLITMEVCSIDVEHRYQVHSLSLGDDRYIEEHKKLTTMIHKYGAKVQPQLTHPGPESLAPYFAKKPSIGPSKVSTPTTGMVSRELSLDELPMVVEQYGEAARRALEAGYDGVELHAAHCYMLLGAFLSPWRNRRRDEYSANDVESRTRFLIEVIKCIKEKTDGKLPLTLRISGYERSKGGRDINDTQRIAPLLEQAGVDAFHVSGGGIDSLVTQVVCGSEYQYGYNVSAAEAMKRVVSVPVMVVGRIHEPELAESVLASNQADMVVFGRPFLADPEWPNKAQAGALDDIRRCISCENCIDSMIPAGGGQGDMNCAVNAQTGRELINSLSITDKPKKVLIVGAGAAGLEAARVAALRGHRVTLLERQHRLGGSLLFASAVHSDNEYFYRYLIEQVKKLPITIKLGITVDQNLIRQLQLDALIVATGAEVRIEPIPGDDLPHVFTGMQLRGLLSGDSKVTGFDRLPLWQRWGVQLFGRPMQQLLTPGMLRSLSRYYLPFGERVTIIGTDLAAIELAEFIAARGRKVSLLGSGSVLAPEVGNKRRTEHMDRLDRAGIVINTDITVTQITSAGVEIESMTGRYLVAADSVIIAGDPVANTCLYDELKSLVTESYSIGDCTGLGLIRKATDDAMRVACAL